MHYIVIINKYIVSEHCLRVYNINKNQKRFEPVYEK